MLIALFVFFLRGLWQRMRRSQHKRLFIRRRARVSTARDPELGAQRAPWLRTQAKPPWVGSALVRMKAFGGDIGYGKLADAFNRRFVESRGMSVSASTVRRLLIKRGGEVVALRREIRNRVPRVVPKHWTWGLDLTTVTDLTKRQRLVLGIVDHGTRACVALRELSDKSSLTILREIIDAIRQFGFPTTIRVDNEGCFTSALMRHGLRVLGIKLRVVQIACPWQNGRIERFFWTFKHAIQHLVIDGADLPLRLIEFRAFYNHVRSHQHLCGLTPSEAWSGSRRAQGDGECFSLWHGHLSGWYFPMRE